MSHITDFENEQNRQNNINSIFEKEVKIIFSTLVTRDGISKPIFQYWKGANNAV